MSDERLSPRLDIDATIFIDGASMEQGVGVIVSKSLDISRTGLQLSLDQQIPVGKVVYLCLELKGKEPIFVSAKSVWQVEKNGEYQIGMMILESEDSDAGIWHSTVATLEETQLSGIDLSDA